MTARAPAADPWAALEAIADTDRAGRPILTRTAMRKIAVRALQARETVRRQREAELIAGVDDDPAQPERLAADTPADLGLTLELDDATRIPAGEAWAREHADHVYRRPNGTVHYRVIAGDGLGFGGVLVQRTSDGNRTAMAVVAFDGMIRVRVADLHPAVLTMLGLPADARDPDHDQIDDEPVRIKSAPPAPARRAQRPRCLRCGAPLRQPADLCGFCQDEDRRA